MSRSDDVVDGVKQMILDGRSTQANGSPPRRSSPRPSASPAARCGRASARSARSASSTPGTATAPTSRRSTPALLLAPVGFIADLPGRRLGASTPSGGSSRPRPPGSPRCTSTTTGSPACASRSTRRPAPCVQVPLDHERLVDADLAFHEEVARASGNPVLAALIEGLAGRRLADAALARAQRRGRRGPDLRRARGDPGRPSPPATPTARGCGWPCTCSGSRTRRRARRRPGTA